jgi:hypothetical protein
MASHRVNLLQHAPILKTMLKSRALQPALMLVALLFFTLAIVAGMFGTPVGNRNFGLVFVWIVWWVYRSVLADCTP